MGSRGGLLGWLVLPTCCLYLCLLMLCGAKFGYSQNQSCNSNDLSALLGFLNGLESGVKVWRFNASSSSSSDCCTWHGVSCKLAGSSERRVVGLDLSDNGLRGNISDTLAGLDHLISLNLSRNFLRGLVPHHLFHLQRLELLDLSMNELYGSIPSDLSLPSIKVFNVSSNSFNLSQPILTGSRSLTAFDIHNNSFSGPVDTGICRSSTRIQILAISFNQFSGSFPEGFGNCSSLQWLALDNNNVSGTLPDDLFNLYSLTHLFLQGNNLTGPLSSRISNLSSLIQLDLSANKFSGSIPNAIANLVNLESFSAQNNRFSGPLPTSLSKLSKLRVLNLNKNSLSGAINLNFTGMPQLNFLDLGSNFFGGSIPHSLSQCSQLVTLNLARNLLQGKIPNSFKNLTSLSYLSLTNNSFSNLSSALQILQNCPNLSTLVLTKNFFHGETMPVYGISGFEKMEVLVIANCALSGSIPQWLANSTRLKVLDISWNHLSGTIPPWLGNLDSLFYLDLSNNSLTGEIPYSLTQMKSLVSRSASKHGTSTQDFPFFVTRNTTGKGLQYNQISSFPPSLVLSYNKLVGPILPAFGDLKMLLVLDLHKNNLSGTIPEELSGMLSIENLDLSYNNLSGSIPSSLTNLTFLSNFDVSYNNLVGEIPTGGQFLTFSSADFEGNLGLCGFKLSSCPSGAPPQLKSSHRKNKGIVIGVAFGIGLGTAFLLVVVYLVVSRLRYRRQDDNAKVVADSGNNFDLGSSLVLLFQNNDNGELTISDILKSTNNFDQAYIVGCGGFGLVYKATLADGRKVAIKRLSGDFFQMEREFQAEVETLSTAQHKNLVLLQGYCRVGNDRLLIYSYMENGSLDYWLHEKLEGGSMLNWNKRLHIAQGAARGLVYLHQSCQPHILHRDIKSSNILLDENFEAHLADFGLARLILPQDTHVSTDLVGTLGYIPPEYGQASVATYRGDVYSFGVVLLELLTGRRPVDMSKPRSSRDLIQWVLQMKKENRESEVFDPRIYNMENDSQMKQMLDIACLCVSDSPKLRPMTQQVVTWLDNIGLQ